MIGNENGEDMNFEDLYVVVDDGVRQKDGDDGNRMDSRPSSALTVPDESSKRDDFSGFKAALVIDWDTPHVHEVQHFFMLLGAYDENKEMGEVVCKNLWALVCCLARDAVTTEQEKQDQTNVHMIVYDYFYEILNNLKLREYFSEQLFEHMGEEKTWPPQFLEFIESKGRGKKNKDGEAQKPSSKRAKKDLSEEDFQKISLGEKIWKDANDFRNEINKFLNPLWIDSAKDANKSGIASNSARLLAIRKHCWPVDCESRAVNTVKARLNKEIPKKSFNRGDPSCQLLVTEAIAKNNKGGMPTFWYPQFWLTFILCGKASGNHVKLSLNSGGIANDSFIDGNLRPATEQLIDVERKQESTTSAIQNLKALGSRVARRAASVAAASSRSPLPTSGGSSTTIEVRHIHQRETREVSKANKMDVLVDKIQKRKRELYEDLTFLKSEEPRDAEAIQLLTKQYKGVSEQLRDAMAKQVEAASVEIDT